MFLCKLLISGLGLGYSPIAPGTMASLATLLFFILFPATPSLYTLSALLILIGTGVYAVNYFQSPHTPQSLDKVCFSSPIPTPSALKQLHDPAFIVIDEIAGMFLVLLALPPSITGWAAGFGLFRLFDIWKPPPIRKLEHLPKGWGVMADDLMAAVYAILIFQFADSILPLNRFF